MAYPKSSQVSAGQVATAQQYNDLREDALGIVGEIRMYAGSTPPNGWLLCDGSAVSRTTYAALFVPVGLDTSQTEFNQLGKTGGAKTHQLTVNELPAHYHNNPSAEGFGSGAVGLYPSPSYNQQWNGTRTDYAGGNQPHNNLQPYVTLNFIIKY
jgi:microcystin-dependent protein